MWLAVDQGGAIAAFASRPEGAAHSMDTDWYAVDRHGRVAWLSSGEEGAVPWQAHRQYWDDLYQDLAAVRIEALISSVPMEPRQVLAIDPEIHTIDPSRLPFRFSAVLHFESRGYLELFRSEYPHEGGWRILEGLPDSAAVEDLSRFAFDDYWQAGAIVGAWITDRPVSPHTIGLFEYECGFSGPYHRKASPRHPLLLDRLPEPLRGRIGSLRLLAVDFDRALQIEPERHAGCSTYR